MFKEVADLHDVAPATVDYIGEPVRRADGNVLGLFSYAPDDNLESVIIALHDDVRVIRTLLLPIDKIAAQLGEGDLGKGISQLGRLALHAPLATFTDHAIYLGGNG